MTRPLSDSVLRHLVQMAATPDLAGTAYELNSELGRGAMGVVYLVNDLRLKRQVAMKVLHASESIAAEAQLAASLEHPGIVPVYETGVLEGGRTYYTMRHVAGKTLNQHLTDGAPLSERLRVMQKICETVGFAHSRGVVHRDLKPGNIMVGPFGEVLLLDWGVARGGQNSGGEKSAVVGTPRYMAPESAAGGSAEAGPLADIYSLGILMGEILPSDAPRPLRAIAARAASALPTSRYADAGAMNLEIGRFLDRLPVQAYREPWSEHLRRLAGRNATLLCLLAAYVAAKFFLFFLRPG